MTDDTITNDDDVIVAVEGEPQPGDGAGEKKAADPAEELKAQFREKEAEAQRERDRAQAAEREAARHRQEAERARQEATAARSQAVESQYDTVASSLAAAQAEIEAAKRDIRAAAEAGDYDRQAEAYDKLAAARAKHDRLDDTKRGIEARKAKGDDSATSQLETQTSRGDPVEEFIATRTEPTQKWLREHRDYLTDGRKNAKLTAAHFSAVGEGIALDTPEYFEHVEKHLGMRGDDKSKAANGSGEQPRGANGQFRRASAPPVAPVQASGGGTSGGGSEVRLTRKEAESATDGTLVWNYDDPSGKKKFKKGDPIGLAEFARRKLEMQRQGLYDKSLTEQ